MAELHREIEMAEGEDGNSNLDLQEVISIYQKKKRKRHRTLKRCFLILVGFALCFLIAYAIVSTEAWGPLYK